MSPKTNKAKRIYRLIEETGRAYQIMHEMEGAGADYAEFASAQALSHFRTALKKPDLTYEQLCRILRRATNREANRQCKTPWTLFMTNCVARYSRNDNAKHAGGKTRH